MPTRRHQPDDPTFHQGSFASAAGFERGILANLVAKRCQLLSDPGEIRLIWWLQQISWRDGGLERFSEEFISRHAAEFRMPAMDKFPAVKHGDYFSAEQIKAIREEFDVDFPLRGERFRHRTLDLIHLLTDQEREPDYSLAESAAFPSRYSFEDIQRSCVPAACDLQSALQRLLVDPAASFKTMHVGQVIYGGRGYGLNSLDYRRRLTDWMDAEAAAASAGLVRTKVAALIQEELDFALESRSFVLIEGREGIGKSEAARAWVAAHPGQAVYVPLESGSDQTTFYRSIARRVGTTSNVATRTTTDIRMRLEDALQPAQLMLVLDEAHFLWPQSGRSERAAPARLDWLRTALIDSGVPIALISTPQFFEEQCKRFRKAGWNANQIQRRLTRPLVLPAALEVEDVMAIARKYFPTLPKPTLIRIASAACGTLGFLGTVVALRKRVDFLARRRDGVSEADLVALALQEIAPAAAARSRSETAVAASVQGPSSPPAIKGFRPGTIAKAHRRHSSNMPAVPID